jgi:hypothetical protein
MAGAADGKTLVVYSSSKEIVYAFFSIGSSANEMKKRFSAMNRWRH